MINVHNKETPVQAFNPKRPAETATTTRAMCRPSWGMSNTSWALC